MKLTPQEYHRLEEELVKFLEAVRLAIPRDEVQNVNHYVRHAEIEMAFESLGLSIIKHRIKLMEPFGGKRLITLGSKLRLNEESVFDPDFWQHLTDYLSN